MERLLADMRASGRCRSMECRTTRRRRTGAS